MRAGGASKAQLMLGLGGQGEDLCLVLTAMKSHHTDFKQRVMYSRFDKIVR